MIKTKKFEDLPQITSISPSGKILVIEQGIDKIISFEDFSNLPATNDVWNNVNTTFTASEVNVTDTQSAADSKLLDLKVNTVSKFVVRKDGNLGIGVMNPAARLDISDTVLAGSGSLAGSALNLAQTWNTTGNPTAIKLNITNTASGATSNLLDLQVGGVSKFNVKKITTSVSIGDTAQFSRVMVGNFGFGMDNGYNYDGFLFSGTEAVVGWRATFGATSLSFTACDGYLGIGSDSRVLYAAGSADVRLYRDSANTFAQRNGVSPQAFRLYNTYTNASNYERGVFDWKTTADTLRIGTENLGTGLARSVSFVVGGASKFTLNATDTHTITGELVWNNNIRLYVSSSQFNIRGSGGLELQGAYPFDVPAPLKWISLGVIIPSSDGVFKLSNYAANDFNRLQFGGTTSSFPAIKRNGAALQIRLADDSANANIEVANLYATGNVGIGNTSPLSKLDIAETWNGSAIAVTGASGTGSIATITFATQSAVIPVGSTIVVASVNPAGYNGTFVVTASSVTSVSYANATTTTYVSGGTVQQLFTAVKVNVTDTASNPTSKLLDLQVGGVSKFSINKEGQLAMNALADPGTYISNPYLGFLFFGGNARSFFLGQDGSGMGLANMSSFGSIGFSSAAIPTYNTSDVRLWRDGAGQLALRNGLNPQTFRLYNTYTDANTFERLNIKWDTNVLKLGTEKGGSGGTARDLVLETDGTERVRVLSTGNVGIGTTSPGNKLHVAGTVNGEGLRVSHSAGVGTRLDIISGDGSQVAVGQVGLVVNGASILLLNSQGLILTQSLIRAGSNTQTINIHGGYSAGTLGNSLVLGSNTINGGAFTATSGTQNTVSIGIASNESWNPASGNAAYNLLRIAPVVNTSGTYAGIVRGLYINPTLTSVTGTDFRALDLSNTSGFGVYQSGSDANNYFAGNVGIGTSTPAARLDIADTTLAGSGSLAGSILNLAQTWNTTGAPTAIKLNVTNTASGAASNLLDLQVDGSSIFNVKKDGQISISNANSISSLAPNGYITINPNGSGKILLTSQYSALGIQMGGGFSILSASTGKIMVGSILYLNQNSYGTGANFVFSVKGEANLRLGETDVAAPVAQTLSVQSVVAGTTNTAGANFTIDGSQGTGTGAGGSIIFRTAKATTSSSTVNSLTEAMSINSNGLITLLQAQTGTGGLDLNGYGLISSFDWQLRNVNGFIGIGASFAVADTRLYRDAANILALRNGVNPQAFRLYNTYTDANTFERLNIKWDTNVLKIGTEKGTSGGTARSMEFQTDGTSRWSISTDGHLIPAAGNTYNIGASGGNSPSNIYVSNNVIVGANLFTGSIVAPGVLGSIKLIDSNGNNFGRLQFGGTTSSFPSIKRNGAGIDCRLADDSADASFNAGQLTSSGGNVYISDTRISRRAQGILMMEYSGTFDRLQFGGTTSSFPAIKRNGAALQIRLADDSANAALETAGLTVVGSASVSGHFSATTKSFLIPHPTKPDKKLQYACLEGPENGVYIRGKTNEPIILLPDYWSELVDADSITVTVTPIGKPQQLFVVSQNSTSVEIGNVDGLYNYLIFAERKDVNKLQTEI